MVTVSTAAATAAAAAAAELPLKGLLALNSRHLAPRTVIIFDMGIFGFFLAMSGLQGGGGRQRVRAAPWRGRDPHVTPQGPPISSHIWNMWQTGKSGTNGGPKKRTKPETAVHPQHP